MQKIKLTIEYVGTDFCGWQSQTNGNSVQDAVEHALGKYFDCDFVRVYAAGRKGKRYIFLPTAMSIRTSCVWA